MDGIKQWAFSVCGAMVACGVAQMVLPKSNMEKIFRTTVSVFFLCCLLSPVLLQNPGLRIEVQEYAQADIDRRARRLTDAVQEQTDYAARREVTKIVKEKLVQMGIKYHDITINMNINGQNDKPATGGAAAPADNPRVDVLLDAAHAGEREAVRAALAEQLGMDVTVRCADAEKEG